MVRLMSHNLKVVSSNLAPATKLARKFNDLRAFLFCVQVAANAHGSTVVARGSKSLRGGAKSLGASSQPYPMFIDTLPENFKRFV